jgi:hypothetical protein
MTEQVSNNDGFAFTLSIGTLRGLALSVTREYYEPLCLLDITPTLI